MAFFDWLSRAGVTLHPGGWAATERLLSYLQLRRGELVVDLGCGSGRTLAYAAQRFGVRTVGVDLMSSLAVQALHHLRSEGIPNGMAVAADIVRLPFRDEVFPFAFAESVFVFLPKPEAFAEVARVLKAGGRFGMIELTWRDKPLPDYCQQVRRFLKVPRYEILSADEWISVLQVVGLTLQVAEKLPSHILPSSLLRQVSDMTDAMRLAWGLLRQVPVRQWQEGWREIVGLFRYTVPGIFVAVKR